MHILHTSTGQSIISTLCTSSSSSFSSLSFLCTSSCSLSLASFWSSSPQRSSSQQCPNCYWIEKLYVIWLTNATIIFMHHYSDLPPAQTQSVNNSLASSRMYSHKNNDNLSDVYIYAVTSHALMTSAADWTLNWTEHWTLNLRTCGEPLRGEASRAAFLLTGGLLVVHVQGVVQVLTCLRFDPCTISCLCTACTGSCFNFMSISSALHLWALICFRCCIHGLQANLYLSP